MTISLLLGPTGSGKTRIIEAAAEILFGDRNAVTKIDCAEFQHSHEIAKLIGSPPGYIGHRETKPILTQESIDKYQTETLKLNFLLFDEIEKARDASRSSTRMLLKPSSSARRATLVIASGPAIAPSCGNAIPIRTFDLLISVNHHRKVNAVGFESHDMAIQIEERVIEFINAHRVARLATADAVGRPAVIPICYVFDGTSFYSAIDQKPKRVGPKELQRIRNIRVNSNVSLVIDDYFENWSELAYVLVRGRAQIIDPNKSMSVEQKTAVAALRLKYVQYRSMAIDQNPLIKIVPDRVRLWSGAPF